MLQKILNMRGVQGPDQSLKQLNLYMVIACFRKLAQRACHTRSMPFFQVLNNVDLKKIDFDKAKPDTTPDGFEITIDKQCLAMFLKFYPGPYEYKCLQYIRASAEKSPIYNKDTFKEFHHLLLYILETYREGLERMKTVTGDDGPSKEIFRKAATRVCWAGLLLHTLNTGAALRIHLQTIRESLCGLAMPSLPKSQKNEADIDPIQGEVDIFPSDDDLIAHEAGVPFNEGNDSAKEEPLDSPQDADGRDSAPDDGSNDGSDGFKPANSEEGDSSDVRHAVASADPDDLDDNTLDDVLDEEPGNRDKDEDDEFEEIESEAGYLATLKWIELLVSQFNSAYLLTRGLPTLSVSLQILKSPPVGVDLMPWKELLADRNFFPVWSPDQHRPGSRLWSNQEIAKFLESGVKANRRKTFRHAQNALDAWEEILKTYQSSSDHQPLFDCVVQSVTWIQDWSTVPGCKVFAEDILKVLKRNVVDILADPRRTSEVTRDLRYITDVCTIFARLSATKFSGSLHCEATLGTLISTPVDETYPQYSLLLDQMQVSHAAYDLHPVFFPPHFA